MFKNLISELKKMEKNSISVPIELDENGFIDKQCPSEECEFLFKVKAEDWSTMEKQASIWCPCCRHEAAPNQWFTIEQIEHAKAEALEMLKSKIGKAMKQDANNFNHRQQKNDFVSISLKVKPGISRAYVIPAKAAESMQLEIHCDACHSIFAVVGSAYFCPACGYNSVVRTFSDSLRKIKAKKDNIELIRQSLGENVGKDDAELTCRSLIETCIGDGVVAFQRYCEQMYVPFGKPSLNAFQRLDNGSQLWKEAIGQGYEDWLTTEEIQTLTILYQKRHLLAHNDGIVDGKYIAKSGDNSYIEGQRIVIREIDIDNLVEIIDKLANSINDAVSQSNVIKDN